MKYLSVSSGIEAATAAWHPLGWSAVGFSEIDPFCCDLLAQKYPDIRNYGDMTLFKEWNCGGFDLLVGGTPCQSFSVAGLRKGLDDPRGNLALVYLGIADRFRPRWLVWENVPGVLSVDGGRAFGSILGGMAQLGYGFAYRVLDAQFIRVESHAFAVPQRRRRVFVVGHLGDWRSAAAVLFERGCLSGDSAPSRKAGKGVAGTLASRAGAGGGLGTDFDLDGGLIHCPEVSPAMKARDSKGPSSDGDGDGLPLVAHALPSRWNSSEDGCGRGVPLVFDPTQITSKANRSNPMPGDPCHTLASGAAAPVVAFTQNQAGDLLMGDVAPSMGTNQNATGRNTPKIQIGSTVRRLTPLECERLQGFPDHYTAITRKGKPAADGPRYKALGNSFAVNVIRWIGERINLVGGSANA